MKTISDLPGDLVGQILSNIPITSLRKTRSTCKLWNALSKHWIFGKISATRQFMGFLIMDYRVCSVRFNVDGIIRKEPVPCPSIKQIDKLVIEISKAFHCHGLLLCVTKDKRLLVWNPYMGQTRWIEPKNVYHRLDRYALGYDNKKKSYKILRFVDDKYNRISVLEYEIYDLNANSWRILNVDPDWDIEFHRPGVSIKGNTYFFAKEKIGVEGDAEGDSEEDVEVDDFLLCFDFTEERFGPRLQVPFHSYLAEDTVSLSCVGEDKLAALFQSLDGLEMEIWVTTNIEPETVSWSKLFLAVDMSPLTGFQFQFAAGSFFIDEEKKLVVVFDLDKSYRYKIAYIIGEDGQFQQGNLGAALNLDEFPYGCPLVCSYLPSLVQINQGPGLSRKRKDRGIN